MKMMNTMKMKRPRSRGRIGNSQSLFVLHTLKLPQRLFHAVAASLCAEIKLCTNLENKASCHVLIGSAQMRQPFKKEGSLDFSFAFTFLLLQLHASVWDGLRNY